METRPQTRVRRSYVDFEPSTELVQEEGSYTMLLELSGFTKEQIKVQIDNSGTLKIFGERPLGDNNWSRFQKDLKVPSNCDTSSIRATFEDGILFVTMTKIINIEAEKQDQVMPVPKTPSSKKYETEPQVTTPINPAASTSQEQVGKPNIVSELESLVNQQNVRKETENDKGHGEAIPEVATLCTNAEKNNQGFDYYKMKDGLVGRGGIMLEKLKYKLGTLMGNGSHKPWKSTVNMVVGILVVVAIGISVKYLN